MNLRQIEMFRAIMATGSFTAAAKLMHISQPGISRAARHLEIQLGVPLFQRRQGRIHATAQAQALYREIERSYRGVKSIQDFAHSLKGGMNSVLRVVASANVALDLVPRAMADVLADETDTQFSLEILRRPLMVEALLQEQADIGISAVALDHPLLESRSIGQWRLVCAFPVGHPLQTKTSFRVQDAVAYPLVAFTSDTPHGQIAEAWFKDGAPRRVAQVRSGQTACALVASGLGIAFPDDLTVRFFGTQGLAWRQVPHSPPFTAFAAWNVNMPVSHVGGKFIDATQRRFKELR